MTPPSQSDFIRELQRLHDVQRAAIQAKDHEAIEDAAHDLTMFLRLSGQGRLAEWFTSRKGVIERDADGFPTRFYPPQKRQEHH